MRWITDGLRREILNDPSRFKVICAGRRWGKTILALLWLMDGNITSGERRWFIAPTYRQGKMILLPLFRTIGRSIKCKLNESELTLTLPNGAEISIKGADNEDSLRGAGLNRVVLDEYAYMKPHVWEEIVFPMLATTEGHAMFIGTPDGYNHFYDLYMKSSPEWKSWMFKTIDGGHVSPEEVERAKSTMDGRLFRQEFEATFETAGNRAAYNFDRDIHIKEATDPPPVRVIGMDFNVDYMTSLLIGEYSDGTVHYMDEIRQSNSNTETMAKAMRNKWGILPTYPDPAGRNRSTTSNRSDHQLLKEHQFQVIARKAHPAVKDRLAALNRQLMDANGKVRMTVDPKCVHLIKDLEQVQRDKKGGIDKSNLQLTHALDACSYYLELKQRQPAQSIAWS